MCTSACVVYLALLYAERCRAVWIYIIKIIAYTERACVQWVEVVDTHTLVASPGSLGVDEMCS